MALALGGWACGGEVTSGDGGLDASMGSPDAGPLCSAQRCAVGQACCIDFNVGNPTCIGSTDSCSGLRVECTGIASCPAGQVCCGTPGTTGTLACATSCPSGELEVCEEPSTTCPSGTSCGQHFDLRYCWPDNGDF